MPAELVSTCNHTWLWFANISALYFFGEMSIKMPVKVPINADIDDMVDNMVDDISLSRTWGSKSTFLSFYLQNYIPVRVYVGFPRGICQDVTRMLLVKHAYAMDDSDWHAMMQCQICEDPLGCNQCYSLLINYVTTNFFLSLYLMQSHNCHMVVVV